MTDSINPEVTMSLEDAVGEVLSLLTGLSLSYDSSYDRFRTITTHLNRALRTNALEQEWSYYHERIRISPMVEGAQVFEISVDYRFRIIGDDAIRFLDSTDIPVQWAYFLPRDALHKYRNRTEGLWAAVTRNQVLLSRPLWESEAGLTMEIPVMREPKMFRLPDDPMTEVSSDILEQQVDFEFPDLVTARAAWLYAQTDPVMQPRVQTLEATMNDLKYALIERDTASTDAPYQNEFIVPVQDSIHGENTYRPWPVSNRR